ncbi:MAG: hypothetical protein HRT66_06165 [Flavobacteriaceae bacterium]|nr:hypothetical protein [Flavobacteriaceae bacterium]
MIAFNIWTAIGDFFVDVVFAPFDAMRETDNWWISNIPNFFFIAVGMVLFAWWMKQSVGFKKANTEDSDK